MLNRKEVTTEQFSTEPVPAVTMENEYLTAAANDGLRAAEAPVRRSRRQSLVTVSPVGGWKVRMW